MTGKPMSREQAMKHEPAWIGPLLWDPERGGPPMKEAMEAPELTARRRAVFLNPKCDECHDGKGTTAPGPGHCDDHDRHCSAAPCW